MLRPTSSPGSSDPSTMWSSRILVTRFFAIVHHPTLRFQTRLLILHTRHSWFARGRVEKFAAEQRWLIPGTALSRSGVVPNSQKGRPRCPPLVVAHEADVALRVFRSRGLPHPGQCVTCSV